MRNAFADEIKKLADADPRVVMMMGDIGNRLFDKYRAAYPERFYNCGVSEANMISMAAGMAACGLRPVCYTITPFITYRALEQIRLDLCYHRQPVVFVGTGSGLSYASLGATHHSLDEMGMLRLLPELKVLCPADANELRAVLRSSLKEAGPVYIRIGKKGEPDVYPEIPDRSHLGKAALVRDGKDATLLAAGTMLSVALAAADLLSEKGISLRVLGIHSIKPLDEAAVAAAFGDTKLVATIEEHSVLGGLGTVVAEWTADHPGAARKPLLRFGTRDEFLHEAGEQEHARHLFGLEPQAVADRIAAALLS